MCKAIKCTVLCVCWVAVIIFALIITALCLYNFIPPLGCIFGTCQDVDKLYVVGPENPANVTLTGEIQGGEWKYYQLSIDTYSENIQMFTEVNTGQVCVAYDTQILPKECNLNSGGSDDFPIFCRHPNYVIIGITAEGDVDPDESTYFAVTVTFQDPSEPRPCLTYAIFVGLFFFALVVIFFVWVLPLFIYTTCFIYRSYICKKARGGEYEKLNAHF